MSRKITLFVMVLSLMISMFCAFPTAASTESAALALDIDADLASVCSEIQVSVSIANNPGISGGIFRLDFDHSALSLIGAEKGSLAESNDSVLVVADPSSDDVAIAAGQTITGDGVFLTLRFRVADVLEAKNYTIGISTVTLEDGSSNSFDATGSSDAIRILDYLWGDANGDKVTSISDVQTILKWKIFILEDEDLNLNAADTDRNGTVRLSDALLLLQWLAGYKEWDPMGGTPSPYGG